MKTLLICNTETIEYIPSRDTKFGSNPELFNKNYPFSIVSNKDKSYVCTSLPTLESAKEVANSIIKYSGGQFSSFEIEEDPEVCEYDHSTELNEKGTYL